MPIIEQTQVHHFKSLGSIRKKCILCIEQGYIHLIKNDSKDISNVTKDFYLKINAVLLYSEKKCILISQKYLFFSTLKIIYFFLEHQISILE